MGSSRYYCRGGYPGWDYYCARKLTAGRGLLYRDDAYRSRRGADVRAGPAGSRGRAYRAARRLLKVADTLVSTLLFRLAIRSGQSKPA